jgi:hypothetical protein
VNVLHNMSAPPRTYFKAVGKTVSGKTLIVSFVWALRHQVRPRAPREVEGSKPSQPANGNRLGRWNWEKEGIPRIGHLKSESLHRLAQQLRDAFEDPAELFAEIGQPRTPTWRADFLIGYRTGYAELERKEPNGEGNVLSAVFCTDPLLCAGILARCAGTLFLSRRDPDTSWDTLLDLPLAFDDPLISFP